ncbi:hypothetical protein GCM10017752_56780 [Streptomyces roseoviridis]
MVAREDDGSRARDVLGALDARAEHEAQDRAQDGLHDRETGQRFLRCRVGGSAEPTVQVATILAGHVRSHIGFTDWIHRVDVCFRRVPPRSAVRRASVPSVVDSFDRCGTSHRQTKESS